MPPTVCMRGCWLFNEFKRSSYSRRKNKGSVLKFVQAGSGAQQVGNDQEFKLHTATSNISRNGYLYVFVSNETPNINSLSREAKRFGMFFDNIQSLSREAKQIGMTHIKSPLLEACPPWRESHYYPCLLVAVRQAFGTEMAGISSRSLPSFVPTASRIAERIGNRYRANGGAEYADEEWSNGSGLEIYETFRHGGQVYRSYNAQNVSRDAKRIGIGRFMQGDPLMEATVTMSGYAFSGNNPVMFTDLLGDRYQYMDRNGNKWHHADIFAGTALEGTPYTEGWGVDGFGNDTWGGGSGSGRGKGGIGAGTGQDYTTFWEGIIDGFNSGKGDKWSPDYGFYNGSLYPEDANWVRLDEVVCAGRGYLRINLIK